MQTVVKALIAGAVGSLTTNCLHELVRRRSPEAPRVDVLGMQAVAKICDVFHLPPLRGRSLYNVTLVADVLSNAAYFALTGLAPRGRHVVCGIGLGLAGGVGAIALPKRLGLSEQTTNRTIFTRAVTLALYATGGLAAGWVCRDIFRGAGFGDYFRGKHAVVTGGSRGLGFVLTSQLLEAGARVTICGRTQEALDSAAATLDSAALQTIACDVRDADDCRRFVQAAVERNGPIDILINNAGIIEVGPLQTQSLDDFHRAMETHFWGPLHLTLATVPGMRNRRSGHIVNVASIGGVIAVPHLAPYCASKFAQIGLTQALGSELATDGIHVTSIVPGLMRTGSPDHATFKGRNRAEFAWFTLADSNPLISVSAPAAARRILEAIMLGRTQAVIGFSAKVAQLLNACAPETTARCLRIAAVLLPRPGGVGDDGRPGAQSHSAWTRNPLTSLNTAASETNNEKAPSLGNLPSE